jgi:transcriptional regulator with XRE-family HTH domain
VNVNITIRAARVNKGLSQTEVAHELGLSIGTYQRMESDLGEMRIKHGRKLARLLDMSPDSLFFGSDYSCAEPDREDENQ